MPDGRKSKKMTNKSPSKKQSADWERIEADYRAGILSLREIAAMHSITEGAIRKRSKRDGWVRDLGAKIQARADDLVRKNEVRSAVRSETAQAERDVIEANAERIAQVRGEHRHDISRMRKLVLDLLGELEAQTGNLDLFERLGELLSSDDEGAQDKRIEIYRRSISAASRIDGLKKLSEAMKTLIGLEREAYGLASIETASQVNNIVYAPGGPTATLEEIKEVLANNAKV